MRSVVADSGRLYFDRLLPFFAVLRESERRPDPAVHRLVATQSAYLIGPRARSSTDDAHQLAAQLARMIVEQFGAVLIVEIWTDARLESFEAPDGKGSYRVRLHAPRELLGDPACVRFDEDLARIRVAGEAVSVSVQEGRVGPRGLPELVATDSDQVFRIGLAIGPWFRDAPQWAPLLYRQSRARLARAVQRLFYRFAASHTTLRPPHFQAIGPRAFGAPTRAVDRRLAEISRSFDLITSLTPINADESWRSFRASGFQVTPQFRYRPVAVDPDQIKRAVWTVPIERVEDPSLEVLFRGKQRELDIQASLLLERATAGVRYNSQRLYGSVSDALVEEARATLAARAPRRREPSADGDESHGLGRTAARSRKQLGSAEFAARARAELKRLCARFSAEQLEAIGATPTVEIRHGISGIVTVHGMLLIGRSFRVSADRAEALVQHEVGTHVLTFLNGMVQPLSLLGAGLDGYEALQEGLALVAELFAGGLDRRRLTLIAARVIAARSVADGADFIDTFRLVRGDAGLRPRRAFVVAMRVHRGGGFIKDHIYLDGLRQMLAYLRDGGDLSLLWTGKVSVDHVPLLQELRHRRILVAPVAEPSYDPRPALVNQCRSVADLARECYKMIAEQ